MVEAFHFVTPEDCGRPSRSNFAPNLSLRAKPHKQAGSVIPGDFVVECASCSRTETGTGVVELEVDSFGVKRDATFSHSSTIYVFPKPCNKFRCTYNLTSVVPLTAERADELPNYYSPRVNQCKGLPSDGYVR